MLESYYSRNKEAMLKYATEKKHCNFCDREIMIGNWSNHLKGMKHKYREALFILRENNIPFIDNENQKIK